MDFISQIANEFLKRYLPDAAPAAVRKRMEQALPKIVAGMEAKRMTLEFADDSLVIRDALFRLWRSVIPSGDIADFIRDRSEGKIVPVVEERLDDIRRERVSVTTLDVVTATLDALIELTF